MEITKKDIMRYLLLIRLNFENAYIFPRPQDEADLITLWYDILKDYPKEVCDRALVLTLKESEFVPRIGSIVKNIEKLMNSQNESDEKLWTAIERVLYDVREQLWLINYTAVEENGKTQGDNANERITEIYDSLPTICKNYLCERSRLINLSTADEKTLSIERACFLKALPRLRESAKLKALTQDLKLIENEKQEK